MGLLKLLVVLLVLAAAGAWFTKPGPKEVEMTLRKALVARLAREELGGQRSPAETVLLATCKLDQGACFELLRGLVEVDYTDRTLYADVRVTGFSKEAECYAAYASFWCPDGLLESE